MIGVAENDAFAVAWFWDDIEVLLRAYDAAGSPQGSESVVQYEGAAPDGPKSR
jgi:hypothetical protein